MAILQIEMLKSFGTTGFDKDGCILFWVGRLVAPGREPALLTLLDLCDPQQTYGVSRHYRSGSSVKYLKAMCCLVSACERFANLGILEHPAEPDQPELPSSWKLPLVQFLLSLPGMQRISLSQGLLGADSRKPTELMALNLPHLPTAIIHWRLTPDVPKHTNIGRDSAGHFKTSHLKEYPPAFCGALAQATFEALSQQGTGTAQISAGILWRVHRTRFRAQIGLLQLFHFFEFERLAAASLPEPKQIHL